MLASSITRHAKACNKNENQRRYVLMKESREVPEFILEK